MELKALILTDLHIGYNHNTMKIYEKFLKDIDQSSFDIIIISGDIASHSPLNFKSAVKLFDRVFPNKKILFVNGNHDYWSIVKYKLKSQFMTIKKINNYKMGLIKDSNWHYLEDNMININGFNIYGFDGWYHSNSYTNYMNDPKNMPIDSGYNGLSVDYLQEKNIKQLNKILTMDIDILVTHFPLSLNKLSKYGQIDFINNPNYLEQINNKIKFIIHGHDHCFRHEKYKNITILNAGSDYNKPKYIIYNFTKETIKTGD